MSLGAAAADAEHVGRVSRHPEAASPRHLLDPRFDEIRLDLLDRAARLADEMVVMEQTAQAEGLLAVAWESVQLTCSGEDRQGPVDRGEARRTSSSAQLVVQFLRGNGVRTISHRSDDRDALSCRP